MPMTPIAMMATPPSTPPVTWWRVRRAARCRAAAAPGSRADPSWDSREANCRFSSSSKPSVMAFTSLGVARDFDAGVGEELGQRASPAGQAGLDGARRGAGLVGDVVHAQPHEVMEHDRLALVLRDLFERRDESDMVRIGGRAVIRRAVPGQGRD